MQNAEINSPLGNGVRSEALRSGGEADGVVNNVGRGVLDAPPESGKLNDGGGGE